MKFYMFSFTQNNLNYNFELKYRPNERFEYCITSNIIEVETTFIEDTLLASFPYYLVDLYYTNLKEEGGEMILFETSNSYNSFKDFYLRCAEDIYTFKDSENTILFGDKYSIKIENSKGYLEKNY